MVVATPSGPVRRPPRRNVSRCGPAIGSAATPRRNWTLALVVVAGLLVWRTGANAATTMVTSGDLVVGGTRVPAGTYTLYTVPGPEAWQLIINRQTGQWGTPMRAQSRRM